MSLHQENYFPELPKNRQLLFILLPIFVLACAVLVVIYYQKTESYAISEARKAALDSLFSHKAVHRYVTEIQRPEIYRLQEDGQLYKAYFSPKTMSFTYIARNIKDLINQEREKAGLPAIYFKLATDNPRNPINQADEFESALLARMDRGEIKEIHEVVQQDGQPVLHVALPIDRSSQGCLKCHGHPGDAPAELIALYGSERGFYESANSIRALISIRVPLASAIREANAMAGWISLITLLIMATVYALIYYFVLRIDREQRAVIASTQIAQATLEKMVAERTAELSIAKEAAETANRAKTAFLATVSHELHTPMNGIMGLTHLALRRTSDPKLLDTLTKVTQSSEKLLGLIDDILDFSRMESERLTLETADFNLATLMATLIRLKSEEAHGKGLQLLSHIAPGLASVTLQGDATRLGQVLAHLTSNAIKFTRVGTVIVRVLRAEETPDDLLLRFEVEDTGIGIAAEQQTRLFGEFAQIDVSMTRPHGGIGLGLALSKRLVQAMGGRIGVSSTEGVGSTFWLTVRLRKVA